MSLIGKGEQDQLAHGRSHFMGVTINYLMTVNDKTIKWKVHI
jgi:hypothetical protein